MANSDPTLAAQIEALAPCPHCGPGQSIVEAVQQEIGTRWQIFCGRCGSSSGSTKTAAEAAALWDRRTPAIVTALRQAEAAPGVVEALQLAHDTLHECTAVLTANDCAKVAGVMGQCRAALARQHGARENGLAWLAERDNLVLLHSTRDDAWQVRRASSGEVRGQGETPRAALQAAMITAAPATDVGER